MPKLTLSTTNFTAGEMSPKLYGHVDLQRWQNAAEILQNVVPLVFGGVRRRYGSSLRATTKFPDRPARLVPFIINRDSAFMLEFGDNYFRVFDRDGAPVLAAGVPYEVPTAYTAAMLWDVDYVQGASEMFMAHGRVPIQRLRQFAPDSWYIGTPPFTTLPFAEFGIYPAAGLTLSLATVGAGRTVAADADVFFPSDVGRAILLGAGIAVVTAYTDARNVTAQIKVPFDSTTLAAGEWNLDASPMTALTILGSGTAIEGDVTGVTLAAPGFRGDEVGQYIRANEGLLKIVGLGDASTATVLVVNVPASLGFVPSLAWTLNASVWNAAFGYPRTVSLYQQRLIAAASPKYPQTVWGSRTGEKLDFQGGTLDDEGFAFTIEADEVNPINYVAAGRNLLALTYGGEFSLKGGVEKPITPTNVQIDPQSPFGSLGVRPINVGKEIIFVQRSARKLRAMAYQYTNDGYVAPDITVLAEHITQSGVRDVAYQQEPDQTIWAVRNDGLLISCTIDRDQDVIAWARHATDGVYESIATIPGVTGDDLWCIVRRAVNGVQTRLVERFESSWIPFDGSPKDWGYTLDSAVAYDFSVAQTTFAGLGHLNGKTVAAVADGASMGKFVVTGGSITLPRAARKVLVGLPFTPLVKTLRPEVQTGTGSAQNNQMRFNQIVLRFYETIGARVNDEVVQFKQFGSNLLDKPPTAFSGDHQITNLGWEKGDAPIVITQDEPLPFHLLGLFKTFTANQQ